MFNTLAQSYTYPTSAAGSSSLSGGALAVIIIGAIIVGAFYVWVMWKIFVKAGRPGWAAIIPVYNEWVLMEISGKPGWWALITLIPYVGSAVFLVMYIIAMLELAKRFGKSATFAIFGMVVFSVVGMPMLAFGKAQYNGGDGAAPMPPVPQAPAAPTPQAPAAPTPQAPAAS